MPSDVDIAVYRALELIAEGGAERAPAGATCRIGAGTCAERHVEGHVDVLLPEARGRNVTGKGGTPWTNARWSANPSNPKSTPSAQRFYPAFEALSEGGLKGDPVMPSDDEQTVIIRLPVQAVWVLEMALT